MSTKDDQLLQATSRLRVGLIGNPVANSCSPSMQQAAFNTLKIQASYELWQTPAQQLVQRIRSLCEKNCLGANVTLPYKEAVLPLLDKIDAQAARIGAVNTIVHRDNYLLGYNTDAQGLLNALHEHGLGELQVDGKVSLHGYTIVLLGAGGAARAAAFATMEAGVKRLIILNRHLERAQLLAEDVHQYYDRPVFSLSDPSFLISHPGSIIINATPLGMHGDVSPLSADILARFDQDTFVYDMIYNPSQTYLLCQARTMGFQTANGLSMLLHQGALSFSWWTNQPAPLGVMRAALTR